jgi:hypothetical protein
MQFSVTVTVPGTCLSGTHVFNYKNGRKNIMNVKQCFIPNKKVRHTRIKQNELDIDDK